MVKMRATSYPLVASSSLARFSRTDSSVGRAVDNKSLVACSSPKFLKAVVNVSDTSLHRTGTCAPTSDADCSPPCFEGCGDRTRLLLGSTPRSRSCARPEHGAHPNPNVPSLNLDPWCRYRLLPSQGRGCGFESRLGLRPEWLNWLERVRYRCRLFPDQNFLP